MRKILLFCLIAGCFYCCSKEDTGAILADFPISYQFDSLQILGTSTYYYTDTLIYKVRNDLVEELNNRGEQLLQEQVIGQNGSKTDILIDQIIFSSPTEATVSMGGSMDGGRYEEVGGIGVIANDIGLAFKVNPNLDQLISCFTVTSMRTIDTIDQDNFIPELDTLYNDDSTIQYQLMIDEGDLLDIRFCDPFGELNLVTEFANQFGLQNNERIVSHRTDLIFSRSE